MKHLIPILALVLPLPLPLPVLGKSAYVAEKVVESVPDVVWSLTPAQAAKSETSGSVIWLGKVELARVAPGQGTDVVLDWLLRHVCLLEHSADGLKEPVHVRERDTGHFIVSITIQGRTPQEAQSMIAQVGDDAYMLVAGRPRDVVRYDATHEAVRVEAVTASISAALDVRVLADDVAADPGSCAPVESP